MVSCSHSAGRGYRLGVRLICVLTLLLSTTDMASAQINAQDNSSRASSNINAGANTDAGTNVNANLSTTSSNTNRNINAGTNPGAANQAVPAVAVKTPCPPADAPPASVTKVYKAINRPPGENAGQPSPPEFDKEVELGDFLVVEGDHFKTLLDEAKCSNKNVVLFLDERPLKDITAYPPTDPNESSLKFPLKRTEQSREVWTYVLGQPQWDPRPTKVSVGIEDKFAVPSKGIIELKVIPHGWLIFWFFLFLLILAGFLLLAIKSNLLRDTGAPLGGGENRPYSLARSQAAWWFFLILASYLFIGMITGDFSTTITGTVLGLLGISAGTVVGSAFVDAGKSTPADLQAQAASAQALQTQLAQIDTDIKNDQDTLVNNPSDPAAQDLAQKQLERAQVFSQLNKVSNRSESFILDILSDINGVSFHRFQIATWTVVLGIIFSIQVYKVLAMPTFDGSLLALLGISAGTYLGLKIPEGTTPKQ